MEVEVDHQDAVVETAGAQLANSHGHVVEDAEALPFAGEGVVQPAAQVDRNPLDVQGEAGGEQGPPDHGALRLQDPFALLVRELEAEGPGEGVRPVQRVKVFVGVDAAQMAERRDGREVEGARGEEAGGFEEAQDPLAAQRIVERSR